MLRNPALAAAVGAFAQSSQSDRFSISDDKLKPFYDYMESVSGRKLKEDEMSAYKDFAQFHSFSMHGILCQQEWKKFPQKPPLGMQMGDPHDPTSHPELVQEFAKDWEGKQRKEKKKKSR